MKKYMIVVEETSTGYSACCPEIDGVIATGETKSSVEANMKSALDFHVEALRDAELEPSSSSYTKVVEFT